MRILRIYIVILDIICITVKLVSQGNYELIYGNSQWHEIVSDAEESHSNIIFFSGFKCIPNSDIYSGFIIKLNEIGEITGGYLFSHPDTSFYPIHIKEFNDSIFVFGQMETKLNNDEKKLIWLVIFDTSMNIINQKTYSLTPGIISFGLQSVKFYDGNFSLLINATPQEEPQYTDICFFVINKNLDSMACRIDTRAGNQLAYDFIKCSSGNCYKTFGRGDYPGAYPFYSELVRFDSNFNYLSVDSIPWKLTDQFSAIQCNDSGYFLTGKKPVTNPAKFNVGLINLSNSDEMIWNDQFGKSGDTSNYPGVSNNVSFISANNIYLGGTSNLIATQYPWQQEESWIMLNQFDSNLNLKFQNFYGGDAFYHLRGIQATNDGGCIMYATRYDKNTQFEEYDAYILKVDSAGLLTSAGGDFQIPVKQVAIVPNPAQEIVSVRYPDIFGYKEKEIEIYNSQGMPVLKVYATQDLSEAKIDVYGLPVGLYFVVLKVEGKKVATGKMLKI